MYTGQYQCMAGVSVWQDTCVHWPAYVTYYICWGCMPTVQAGAGYMLATWSVSPGGTYGIWPSPRWYGFWPLPRWYGFWVVRILTPRPQGTHKPVSGNRIHVLAVFAEDHLCNHLCRCVHRGKQTVMCPSISFPLLPPSLPPSISLYRLSLHLPRSPLPPSLSLSSLPHSPVSFPLKSHSQTPEPPRAPEWP